MKEALFSVALVCAILSAVGLLNVMVFRVDGPGGDMAVVFGLIGLGAFLASRHLGKQ